MASHVHIKPKSNSIKILLRWGELELKKYKIPSPLLDAEVLLVHVLQVNRHVLLTDPSICLTNLQKVRYQKFIRRRCQYEPVAFLTQKKEFMSLSFRVTPDVLIPRPETELLVEEVISQARELHKSIDMLDIGTGSGCIAVSCAKYIKNIRIVALEKNRKALNIAKENAQQNDVKNFIKFYRGDIFKGIPKTWGKKGFDFVVSNPPYIARSAFPKLQKDVWKYEPKEALVGGKDGLEIIRNIITQTPEYLKPNGLLMMEIGYDQGNAVKNLLQRDLRYNLKSIVIKKDYAGLDRIAIAQKG